MKFSKKLSAMMAFALASVLMLSSAMGVLAADTDEDVNSNKITFSTGGGGDPTDPVEPEDPDNPIDPDPEKEKPTGNTGALRLDVVPAFDFGSKQITVGAKSYDAVIPTYNDGTSDVDIPYYVQVSDLRGTGDGWGLKAQMTKQFATTAAGTTPSYALDGAKIVLKNVQSDAQTGTTAPSTLVTTDQELDFNSTTGTGSIVNLASAATNEGMGVSVVRFGDTDPANVDSDGNTVADKSVELTIPAATQVYAGNYTATIKWTLEATPITVSP